MLDTRGHQPTDVFPGELVGFRAVALDGLVGTVDAATWTLDSDQVVLATRRWLVRRRRCLVDSRTVRWVDHDTQTVHLDMVRQQVWDAAPFVPLRGRRLMQIV